MCFPKQNELNGRLGPDIDGTFTLAKDFFFKKKKPWFYWKVEKKEQNMTDKYMTMS